VQDGKLIVLGVTAPQRVATLPEVPTMLELGLADFVVEGWWAIYLPAGAPREAVERLNAATNAFLRQEEALTILRNNGVTPLGGTPEDLAARTAAEVAKWRAVIRDARIEPS
jgi:tripartite-type tricarboxylate transporter receptor subunit TctC